MSGIICYIEVVGASIVKSRIKELMEEKGITYTMLEDVTGLSSQTITRARGDLIIECRLSTLETIARALEVNISELFVDNFGKESL